MTIGLLLRHQIAITPSEHSLPQRLNYSLISHLQTVIASNIFTPRAVYDGKKNMWAATELALGPTNSKEVCVSFSVRSRSLRQLSLMSSYPKIQVDSERLQSSKSA